MEETIVEEISSSSEAITDILIFNEDKIFRKSNVNKVYYIINSPNNTNTIRRRNLASLDPQYLNKQDSLNFVNKCIDKIKNMMILNLITEDHFEGDHHNYYGNIGNITEINNVNCHYITINDDEIILDFSNEINKNLASEIVNNILKEKE